MAKKKKFRVKGHIKSFRDLEIYNKTTLLSTKIHQFELPSNLKGRKRLAEQLESLEDLSLSVPKLIAESYGDRYVDRSEAYKKLEDAMRNISRIIAGLDFAVGITTNNDIQKSLLGLIKKYQIQRRKVLNLKRAWIRIAKKFEK